MTSNVSTWLPVQLKKVLTYIDPLIKLDDEIEYTTITVKRRCGGLEAREKLLGVQIQTKKQFGLVAGAFIISRVQCWHQAYAIVPNKIEPNTIASINYDQFVISPKVDRRFFWWLTHSPEFVETIRSCAFGVVIEKMVFNREAWLDKFIFLPPLEEQQRIVARIEELVAKIEEARGLRREIFTGYEDLCRSILFGKLASESRETPLKELVRLREPDVFVRPDNIYHFAGIYSFGKGIFQGPYRAGTETAYSRLTRLHTNDFVYPKLMAWEGAYAVVPAACNGLVVSTEFPVFEINQERVLPETLEVYFRTPSVWPVLSDISTGTNVRRRRLNPSDFLSFNFPLPNMVRQVQLRTVKQKVDTLKRIQAETSVELNALLPSILDKAFKGEL